LEAATTFRKEAAVVICYGKPTLNGGSIIKTLKTKTTLIQTDELTLS
jgi:hypothetical protein